MDVGSRAPLSAAVTSGDCIANPLFLTRNLRVAIRSMRGHFGKTYLDLGSATDETLSDSSESMEPFFELKKD